MTPQPILDVVLDMPPKPKARVQAMVTGKGKGWKKCRACHHPVGAKCGVCGNTRVRAVNRPVTNRGHKEWNRLIHDRLKLAWWGNQQLRGPLRVHLTFVVERPATRRPAPAKWVTQNKIKVLNPRREAGDWYVTSEDWKRGDRVLCPVIPDVDRLTNAIFDSLTEVRVWFDDAQVADLRASKWYAAKGEGPSIRLRVEAA